MMNSAFAGTLRFDVFALHKVIGFLLRKAENNNSFIFSGNGAIAANINEGSPPKTIAAGKV